jgi:Putative zincin peptidase
MEFPAGALKATRVLPDSYVARWGLDLAKDTKAALLLNLAALPAFLLFTRFFIAIASEFRSEITVTGFVRQLSLHPLAGFVSLIVTVIVFTTIHEGIHGLFFWLFTHSRPVFGLKLLFAYAGAPEWFIPRSPYAMIGLAPIVCISIVGLVLVPLVSLPVCELMLFGVVLNASGAVGDLYVTARVLAEPRDCLVLDTGVGCTVFTRVEDVVGNPTV